MDKMHCRLHELVIDDCGDYFFIRKWREWLTLRCHLASAGFDDNFGPAALDCLAFALESDHDQVVRNGNGEGRTQILVTSIGMASFFLHGADVTCGLCKDNRVVPKVENSKPEGSLWTQIRGGQSPGAFTPDRWQFWKQRLSMLYVRNEMQDEDAMEHINDAISAWKKGGRS
ncbi:hypothetical protein EJ06DRAFT_401810 [Trichodelitschia bisporula]|uniref:Uncharacterized protein n=1 Tax=Trichodelitschia bisporula TaxID=703511 RepID=A0A6G1HX78_9PEZI|nr:hypothetical protein EJ06DRAFT_401810 [Trichodelitschia bisporula]